MIPQYEKTIERVREKLDTEHTSRVFKIDWEKKRLTSQHIDGKEAMNQAIQVITSVEWRDWGIFPEWFGLEMKNMYGMPRPFVKANLERLIKEACETDDRIIDLVNFEMEDIEKAVVVRFTVECTQGIFETEVEIKDV